VLDVRLRLGLGSEAQQEERMLKRQITLKLNTEAEAEGAWVWRSIPSSDQQRIVELLSRSIGRTARQRASAAEKGRDSDNERSQR
jgi:phage terminase Nu1 subunit (DNA packaging protein)